MADAGQRTEKMTLIQYAALRNRRRGQMAQKIDAMLKSGYQEQQDKEDKAM